MIQGDCKVAVIADWDADGVVSAALILYAQGHRAKFPLEERTNPCLIPAGPRSIRRIVEEDLCWPVVVILDIPFTPEVEETIRHLRSCGARIYYFDHHHSTIEALRKLEDEYGVFIVVGRSPTSVILQSFLGGLGIRLTPRLREFVKAIAVLEGGKRKPAKGEVPEGIVTLAASISKALNQLRDENAWRKYVRWVASPLPFEEIRISIPRKNSGEGTMGRKNIINLGIEISQESDQKIRQAAMDLAMGARNLGYIKFVDARGRWEGRGASALASNIFKIVSMPVALLVEKEDGSRLLILRSGRGEARRIAEILYSKGVITDIGGHKNIAVARISDEITERRLENELRKASFEAARQLRGQGRGTADL